MNVFWDRSKLKQRAKEVLRGTYWRMFGVLILAGFLTGGISTSSVSGSAKYTMDTGDLSYAGGINSIPEFMQYLGIDERQAVAFIVAFAAAFLLSLCASGFFSNVVVVGSRRFICLNRFEKGEVGSLFFGFSKGRYGNIVGTMLLKDIYLFLWSLLFVIPGVIKVFSYWMVPYILAENPGISASRAFEISKKATKGEKWRIFVFELSFIGWHFLGALAFGVGHLFVTPYVEAARAELYAALRYKAAMTGICTKEDIGYELF